MAELNLLSRTIVNKRSKPQEATTSLVDILTVPADELYEVTSILATNIDGTNSVDVTIQHTRSATGYQFVKTISVPADAVLVPIAKDTEFNLQENDSLQIQASANGDCLITINYMRSA